MVQDTNSTSYTNFWLNQFEPAAIDSCFGIADTMPTAEVTLQAITSVDTMRMCNIPIPGQSYTASMKVERKFRGEDLIGNIIGVGGVQDSDFVLTVYYIDTISPAIVDTPMITGFDEELVGVIIDTFVIYTDADTCGAELATTDIDITVTDVFWGDSVRYSWKVNTISGMPPANINSPGGPTVYNKTYNSATQFYPVGLHEITYLYQDSCANRDSFQLVLEVRDTQAPVVVTDSFKYVLYYDAVGTSCIQDFTYEEPDISAIYIDDNCGTTTQNLTITRVLSADTDPDLIKNSNQDTIFDIPDYGTDIDLDFPAGISTIYYIFKDLQGNLDTITYLFDVRDTIAPSINCVSALPNLIVNGVNCIGALPDYRNSIFVNASDVCGLDTIEQKPMPGFMIGNDTVITFIAIDLSGNKDSCSLPLSVIGTLEPTPLDTTTQCVELTLEAPLAVYNCMDSVRLFPLSNDSPNGTNPESYTFSLIGANPRTINWIFNDENGNFVKFIPQKITFIADTTEPTVVTQSGSVKLYLDTTGMITVDPGDLDNGSTDNCSPTDSLKLTTNITSIPCDSLSKTFDIRLYVADELGNTDSADVSVTICDNIAPIFLDVPRDTVWSCSEPVPGQATLAVMDNCSGIDTMYMDTVNTRVVLDTPSVANLRPDTMSGHHNYTITYRWIAEDSVGNRDTTTQIITVVDTLAPAIDYPDTMYVGTAADATTCSAVITIDLAGKIQDNCYDTLKYVAILDETKTVELTDTNTVTFPVPMGDTTVFIIAEDFANNRDTQALTIRVADQTDPVPRCINALAISVNAFGYVVIDSSVINQNSIDNCTAPNDLRFELSRDTFRCSEVGGTYEVVMTVIDEAGNRHSCSSQVTIQDFTGTGSFACPGNVTINCDDSTDPIDTGIPTVTDICGDNSSLTYNDIIVAGSGGVCQIIQRTWVVTDTSGTQTTCVQFINLVDTIAPVLAMTFSDVTVACIDDAATADSILVTDNCVADYYAHASQSATKSGGNLLVQKIWTAGDSCTTVIDTQIITIVDVTAPVISLPMDTFKYYTADFFPDSCGVLIPPINFGAYVTDCNASLGLTVRHSDPDNDTTAIFSKYLAIGTYNMTVTASDPCGNTATQPLVIQVIDNSIPTLVCVENLIVSLGTGGTGILIVNNVLSSVSDNCGDSGSIDTLFLSQTNFDCSDLGMNEVTLTAIDTSGNVGTCTVDVEVVNQGNTDFIEIALNAQDESINGFGDGMAWVTVMGGSGNYTYQWSPGGATTDTVKNLTAGLYTVVVNDIDSGCRLTDTVRVNPGSTVHYTVCDVPGIDGNIIQVPIKVSNFTDILSVDLSFNISDPSIARFVNADKAGGFNLGDAMDDDFTFISDGRLLFAINLDPTNGETLPDGTVIFFVNVELLDTGSVSLFISGNSVADIETSALINGSSVVVASSATTGTITSNDVNSNLSFGGTVTLVAGGGLAEVEVTLSGDATGIDSTDASGVYSFDVMPGQSLTVTPAENRNHKQGLTVTDLALIQRHILGIPLDSPYKILAADVNNSETITVTDLAIIQAVILGTLPQFIDVPSWKFIPADFVLNATNPWASLPLPNSISTVSGSANFIAFKMGDVNYSATTVEFQRNEAAESRATFRFGLDDQYLKAGDVIEVPFKAKDFKEMYAYQMTLNANPEWLSFEGVNAGALADISAANFGLTQSAKGRINTLWYSAEPLNIEQNAILFTISFRVNKGGKYLSDILRASSDILLAEAHATNTAPKNINLTFDKNSALSGFELFQNKPNPFSAETTISFNLPKAITGTLRFYDFSGRMVHRVKSDFVAGTNNVIVHKNDLSGSGVLYYELATPTFTARKKMIVLD